MQVLKDIFFHSSLICHMNTCSAISVYQYHSDLHVHVTYSIIHDDIRVPVARDFIQTEALSLPWQRALF